MCSQRGGKEHVFTEGRGVRSMCSQRGGKEHVFTEG